jgi:hypothetical protein
MLGNLWGSSQKLKQTKPGATRRRAIAVAATTTDPAVTALIRGAVVDKSVAAGFRKAETLAPD